jgi:dipeptidyl aminopeptidase/acylaminoacyl peptidase
MRKNALFALALACLVATTGAWAQTQKTDDSKKSTLTFSDIFPRKRFGGKSAADLKWSYDDRYLAYKWNAFNDKGYDLWIYDTKEGKAKRLTTMDTWADVDRDVPKYKETYKKWDEEEQKTLAMSEEDYRKHQVELRTKPNNFGPGYPGPGEIVWANTKNELLLTYKGDVYRWKIGDAKPTRLTKSRDAETDLAYTPDDKGWVFKKNENLYRMMFDSPFVEQLNPELPNGMGIGGYALSPDGTKLMISTWRDTKGAREVDYITYRERFAKAEKTGRDVADDPFRGENFIYIYDLNDDPKANPKNDGKPWEVLKIGSPDELQGFNINDKPWSPDSKKLTFATWKRDQRLEEFYVVDVEAKKAKVVYKANEDGEHTTHDYSNPFYTPDGKKIVTLLETSGYRHAWLIDPFTEGATQLTKGDFEVYPISVTKDGKSLFVRSSKESPARMNLYRADMQTGELKRLSTREGSYGEPTISHNGERIAVGFRNFLTMNETYLMDAKNGGKEVQITDSHRKGYYDLVKVKPQLFTYKDRNGQTIWGTMYLPPNWTKDKKWPLYINVYGGPLGQGHSVNDDGVGLWDVFLAYTKGIIVVTIDPRGQSGYGAVFGKANFDHPGVAQVEDLTDGVNYLKEKYNVDAKKVGVSGWSFGGFQTQMCMYTAPDVFTLGIAGAGPTEWQNYNSWYSGGVIGKSKAGSNPPDLDKFSLTKIAQNLKSPLLLLHGMEDTNVLFQDTIHVYQKLMQWGKGDLVELVIDPTGDHGLGGDISYRDTLAIYLRFIEKWWGKTEQ